MEFVDAGMLQPAALLGRDRRRHKAPRIGIVVEPLEEPGEMARQAGAEVRVMVKPEDIDDDAAALLSHEIAREIEESLEYPGQIKVTVIRESRAVEVAK